MVVCVRAQGSEEGVFRRLGSHPQDNKDLLEKFPHIEEAIRLVCDAAGRS